MNVHFVLIGEGSSDEGLIPHLESLCIEAGADEVTGIAPDLTRLPEPVGHTLDARIPTVLQLEPHANLLFVQRDADSRSAVRRHNEVRKAVVASGTAPEYVAVIPVQELEAWLLLDETAIRKVAGRPNGCENLDLPRPARVESVARPKERLKAALLTASQLTGRRHRRFVADFPSHRKLLLHRLPVGGPLLGVPAWVAMRAAIDQAIQRLTSAHEGGGVGDIQPTI